MEALSESRRTFIRGRGSLQAELANISFLKPEKCTTSGGASVYRPLQGGGTPRVSDENGAKTIPYPYIA